MENIETVVMSDTPHIRSYRTTKNIMLDVVIALLPACLMGCIFFGWEALMVIAISCVSAIATEVVWKLCEKKSIITICKEFDFTSLITGLLIAMCMPSTVAWYVPMLSAIFAIAVVKMLFGGTGKNIVNPAIVGRIFAFMSFTTMMSTFDTTLTNGTIVSGATELSTMLATSSTASDLELWQMFIGINLAGCLGETCKLALLIGGIYLVVRKVIDIRWPLIYIVSCGLMSALLYGDIAFFMPSILTGGLFLGAIFMATDYVTSPNNKYASYAYYLCLGLLTAGLRKATHMEVVSFAILIMNLLVPIFNKVLHPRPFGSEPLYKVCANFFKKLFSKKNKEEK